MSEEAQKALVPITHFGALDLRAGTIVAAERHPNADRLLVLKVDVGDPEPRQIVAGIAAYYPDVAGLVGRTIIVVCNLEPATLRGVRSEGMLLAAGGKNHRGLLTVAGECPAGERIG